MTTITTPPPAVSGIATLSIERLAAGRRGPRYVNALIALGEITLFQTKRGHRAIRVPRERLTAALSRLGLETRPSYDGLMALVPVGAPIDLEEENCE